MKPHIIKVFRVGRLVTRTYFNKKINLNRLYKPRTQAVRMIPQVVEFIDQKTYTPEHFQHMLEMMFVCETIALGLQIGFVYHSLENKNYNKETKTCSKLEQDQEE